MEREKGYLIIDNFKKIDKPVKGGFCISWFLYQGIEYLFKEIDQYMAYNELFYSLLLTEIGIKTAEYDLAKREKATGVITPNFNPKHLPSYSIEEILLQYEPNSMKHKFLYNLEDLPKVLDWFCQKNNLPYKEEIEKNLSLQFIIQLLLGNQDLRAANIEYFIDKDLKMSVFYDFSYYGSISLEKKDDKFNYEENIQPEYKLNYSPATYYLSPYDTFEFFLKYGKKKDIILLKEYLERLKEVNINNILKKIKEQTEKNIPRMTKEILIYQVTSNLEDAENIMKLHL